LRALLEELALQETNGEFDFSIIIVDNDAERSAEDEVKDFAKNRSLRADYYVEPRQNISLARNKAIENASGEFIAFIDDDEVPVPLWLGTLYRTLNKYGVDGVLGPTLPSFDPAAPQWLVKGGFHDRASYPTGFVIDGRKGRTGNVLIKREVCIAEEQAFRPEFRSGEDQDFFGRMIEKGFTFIWCNEAIAYETVPPIRWEKRFLIKKAMLQGACAVLNRRHKFRYFAKSLLAISIYVVVTPFAFLLGQRAFMQIMVRLFDHLGQVLAVIGYNPIKQAYVTE
jgi:glycosyltransferase involved in cell wall biosynthesis